MKWYAQIEYLGELDWMRFALYSRRVKSFYFGLDNFDDAKTAVEAKHLARLVRLCPMARIFPRLEVLDMVVLPDASGSIAYVAKFFAETTRSCAFVLNISPEEIQSARPLHVHNLVQGILLNSPYITSFGFYSYHRIQGLYVEECFVRLLAGLRRMTKAMFDSDSFSAAFLEVLARLPQLEGITIDGETEEPTAFDSATMAAFVGMPDVFGTLTTLWLKSQPLRFASLLVTHSCFQQLNDLTLTIKDEHEIQQLHEMFATIARVCKGMKVLRVSQGLSDPDHPLRHVSKEFTRDTIKPLRTLKHLKSFSFNHVITSALTDADVLQLVKDCPALEEIRLNARTSVLPLTNLTPALISSLSRQDNRLRSLQLCIHFKASDISKLLEYDVGDRLRGLYRLGFGHSIIDVEEEDEAGLKQISMFIEKCVSDGCRCGERPHECNSDELELDINQMKWDCVWEMCGR